METDDNFIDCKCPFCAAAISYRLDAAGGLEKCPECMEDLVVPAVSGGLAGKIPLPVTTPRLLLRRLAATDWKDLVEFLSDEELHQYLESAPVGEKEVLEWLEADRHAKLTVPNTTFSLGMELKPKGKVIGIVYLRSGDGFTSQASFEICVSRKFQRQGFGTEALQGVLGFSFDGIGLHRVSTWCDTRNIAACRLAGKTGLRREGELLKERFVNGEWIDTVLFAILNEEFQPPAHEDQDTEAGQN